MTQEMKDVVAELVVRTISAVQRQHVTPALIVFTDPHRCRTKVRLSLEDERH